jgi:hypothetical protein
MDRSRAIRYRPNILGVDQRGTMACLRWGLDRARYRPAPLIRCVPAYPVIGVSPYGLFATARSSQHRPVCADRLCSLATRTRSIGARRSAAGRGCTRQAASRSAVSLPAVEAQVESRRFVLMRSTSCPGYPADKPTSPINPSMAFSLVCSSRILRTYSPIASQNHTLGSTC